MAFPSIFLGCLSLLALGKMINNSCLNLRKQNTCKYIFLPYNVLTIYFKFSIDDFGVSDDIGEISVRGCKLHFGPT